MMASQVETDGYVLELKGVGRQFGSEPVVQALIDINLSLEPGETQTIEFDAHLPGTFTYYCTEFCSALHLEMMGYFLVEP